jgi:hypothetical protein
MRDFFERALLNTIGPVISLVLAAVIGQRLGAYWAERQKRREFELSLANAFYQSYGEFCSVWKYWNQSLSDLPKDSEELKSRRDSLLDRASTAEGGLEAALLKVASERVLDESEQADLGNLRQAYQVLRERIREGVSISYGVSSHPDYLEFKRLATRFGVLLASQRSRKAPTPEQAYLAFREITDNKHAARWLRAKRSLD